jgi:hypothetical protein
MTDELRAARLRRLARERGTSGLASDLQGLRGPCPNCGDPLREHRTEDLIACADQYQPPTKGA